MTQDVIDKLKRFILTMFVAGMVIVGYYQFVEINPKTEIPVSVYDFRTLPIEIPTPAQTPEEFKKEAERAIREAKSEKRSYGQSDKCTKFEGFTVKTELCESTSWSTIRMLLVLILGIYGGIKLIDNGAAWLKKKIEG